MKYLERFLRYIFWLVVTASIAWIAKKIFEGAAQRPAGNSRGASCADVELPKAKPLFRDPVCGTYVAEDISYALKQGGESLRFCSRECLEHYQRDLQDGRGQSRLAAGA